MANSKHTPGPWRLGIEGTVVADSADGLTIGGATGKENTDYYGGNLICESISMANAKLTAAAPEMLDALLASKAVFEALGIYANHRIAGEQYDKVVEVIKKATK